MIKKIAVKLFHKLGYEIHKIYNESSNDVQNDIFYLHNSMKEALTHLKKSNFNPDLIIDVGAANCTPPLLEVFPETEFLWIEPLIEFKNDLEKLKLKFKGDYIIGAADLKDGKSVLNVHENLLGSSLLKEVDGAEADGKERIIDTFRIDNLPKFTNNVPPQNILLKIDTQGAELNVLEGCSTILKYIEVIILEVSFFEFQIGIPIFHDVVKYMKDKGYVAYDIFDGHLRPLDFALAQKDILFVKENGRFRKSNKWASNEIREQFNK